MIFHILNLVLNVCASLIAGAALLRLYLQYHYIPLSIRSGNPFAPFVFALTNWIVLPLRRIVPSLGKLDTSSLLAAVLIIASKTLIMSSLGMKSSLPLVILLDFTQDFFSLVLSCISSLVLAYVLLSWIQKDSPLFDLLTRMVLPMLTPIRRFIKPVAGLDWSVLVLFLLIQIAEIILADLHHELLQWSWSTI